jgi:ABC-type nitrate/sulfonate/bicarbonate transport system ATPase subunit
MAILATGSEEETVAEIAFDSVWKRYPDGFEAVKDMNLEINDGEFMILVGPSGCGKSTALRMIAGLEDITEGELIIGGERVNDLAPRDRDIAMVFQNYAPYPHLSASHGDGQQVVARLSAESSARPGAEIELSIDTGRIQLFDQTGARLAAA